MRKKIGLIVGEQDATYSSILVSNIYEEAKKYDRPGPTINERFGPGMPESLIADK